MKCWFQIGDGKWQKGTLESHASGSVICFICKGKQIVLRNPEILFGSRLCVTGYWGEDKEGTYRLVSVDVVFRKGDIPKEEK